MLHTVGTYLNRIFRWEFPEIFWGEQNRISPGLLHQREKCTFVRMEVLNEFQDIRKTKGLISLISWTTHFLLLFNILYLTYILHEYLTNWKSGEGLKM